MPAESPPRSDDDALLAAARAEAAAGRRGEAHARLLRLREARRSVALELGLAEIEQALGDPQAAIAALEAALAIDPSVSAAWKNLSALHAQAGRNDAAREVLERAVRALPANASLRMRLARMHALLGDSAAAIAGAAEAEALAPPDAATWRDIGRLRAEYFRWEDANRALDEAARRDPGAPATETLRALVKQEVGDMAGADQALRAAAARHPGRLDVAIAERLLLPQVYADEEDLARWRARYRSGLHEIVERAPGWMASARDVFFLDHHNFLLAYQGEDDLELQRAYSGLLATLAGAAHPEWRAPRRPTFDGSRRLRVGFVGNIFRDCTAGRYFERWVTGLDGARFERFVYHTAAIDDDFTRRIASGAEHFTALRTSSEQAAARLAHDALDVIVYPEVGMTPLSYLLAALRLAPVQCAGWGHPVTTGSDAIDFYFTCGAMEPGDGPSHYVERLVALPGLGVEYSMPEPPGAAARRDLGLPEAARIHICPQSLFKIHPAMDALFVAVLEADPEAVLAFFQAPARAVTMQFAARLQRAMQARGIPARGQLKFLPRMSGAGFRRALALADVVLDTVRWSGGNTSLDAIAAGTPVVTLPGRFMRARQTAAMLRIVGLDGLVAGTPEEYVRLAVETARDRDRNAALRETIARNRAALFDRPEPLARFAEALLEIAAES
jgi:CRISPR-associated protein Csy1